MAKKNNLKLTSLILAIIGGINWGLMGIGGLAGKNMNLVNLILRKVPILENLIYIVIGLAAVYLLVKIKE